MRRVHINNHKAFTVFSEHINAADLRERAPERERFSSVGIGTPSGTSTPPVWPAGVLTVRGAAAGAPAVGDAGSGVLPDTASEAEAGRLGLRMSRRGSRIKELQIGGSGERRFLPVPAQRFATALLTVPRSRAAFKNVIPDLRLGRVAEKRLLGGRNRVHTARHLSLHAGCRTA